MNAIQTYAENTHSQKNFYPTPDSISSVLLDGINWNEIESVLEPSAGKGDLAGAVYTRWNNRRRHGLDSLSKFDIDCIEIDPNLQAILKEKDFRVVHDDFLSLHTFKRYSLIVMNPPFDQGAKHLLKALSMQERGGLVRCILNAETLKNPCYYDRQDLARLLAKYGAEIEYRDNAFTDAERKTGVEIALVKVTIPAQEEITGNILDQLHRAQAAREERTPERAHLAKGDFIDAIVDKFNFEAEAGCKLIHEYRSLLPYLKDDLRKEGYPSPILDLKIHGENDATENEFIRKMRCKYWQALFSDHRFMQNMTNNLQRELYSKIGKMRDYDFSVYNIHALRLEMQKKLVDGIHDTIMTLFDDWTRKYHYDEHSTNRHYYNGWKTNDAFAVNKKVIVPFYRAYSQWSGKLELNYEAHHYLSDIEKVFDYLTGNAPDTDRISRVFATAQAEQNNKKIPLRYFTVTFYKKGTCHIEFTDMDVLHKFNLYAAKDKNWLPPVYGKKKYKDMTKDEKAVIDSFEGEKSYTDVLSRADYFLSSPVDNGLLKIGGGEDTPSALYMPATYITGAPSAENRHRRLPCFPLSSHS